MDFEHNAVESDYDEHYDNRHIVIENGQAKYVSMADDYVKEEIRIQRDIPSFAPQPILRQRRGPVQLPRDKPAEVLAQEAKVEPALVLPKGGWKVQHIKQPSVFPVFEVKAELSRTESIATPRPQATSPKPAWIRINKWKNITNEILTGEPAIEEVQPEYPKQRSAQSVPERVARPPRQESRPVESQPFKEDEEKRQNTKICRFVEISFKKTAAGIKTVENNKCRRPNCTYAHTMENWKPRPCRFQGTCRSADTCPFKHEAETRESYYERTKNMF